ncbi:hypothetical protein BRAS3843_180011 [Bradyrhizobium sp. STM 3843]|nr:hypothetical protein BRAS3843_180011 [Bradyrhizobium sp. STM 3843]
MQRTRFCLITGRCLPGDKRWTELWTVGGEVLAQTSCKLGTVLGQALGQILGQVRDKTCMRIGHPVDGSREPRTAGSSRARRKKKRPGREPRPETTVAEALTSKTC